MFHVYIPIEWLAHEQQRISFAYSRHMRQGEIH